MGDENEEREREERSRGFTVVDRRGTEREEAPGAEAPPSGGEGAEGSARTPPPGESAHAGSPPPPIDFATFVLSLGTSALYHLGLVEDPQTGEKNPRPNVPLARQTIDTIEMLRDKTRGNLSDEESRLLDSLLYELRMQFVESSQ